MKEGQIIWKNEGETPLQCLDRLRVEYPKFANSTLSYAGRLDPMADGLMLVLVDDENKNRGKYLNLDKTYEVDILFGINTDTGDLLGLSSLISDASSKVDWNLYVGKFMQAYPTYSSKTVNGKPLFEWARSGKIIEIEIPKREVEIYSIEILDSYQKKAQEILELAKERISKVKGDFRQDEIIKRLEECLSQNKEKTFNFVKIKVGCSSGTYMRGLAKRVGGIAWKIRRTAISTLTKVTI